MMGIGNGWRALLALAASLALLAAAPAMGATIPAGGLKVSHASLDWSGNAEMQKAPPFGGSNYFSAGVSNGKEGGYKAVDGNVAVYQVDGDGEEALASWATRAAHVSGGGKQLVRLSEGSGRIEADGAATIAWDGSFSVNFYGGLVPFTVTDPRLTVGADGSGELVADLVGCSSSIDNPNECDPLSPFDDATVATFSGVTIDPDAELTITPDYSEVEVELPEGSTPQLRTGSWGAWPQDFVDFHMATGLSSYWYSSGGAADSSKPPLPFTVAFNGPEAIEVPGGEEPAKEEPVGDGGSGGGSQPKDEESHSDPTPSPSASPAATAAVTALGGVRKLDRGGQARVATLSCLGSWRCTVNKPKRVPVKIAGKRFPLLVLAPGSIRPGGTAALKVRLSRAARAALGGGTAKAVVRLRLRSRDGVVTRTFTVRIGKS